MTSGALTYTALSHSGGELLKRVIIIVSSAVSGRKCGDAGDCPSRQSLLAWTEKFNSEMCCVLQGL